MRHLNKKVKVIIAAGGTGGHVFPGVAIAEEIKRSHPEAVVRFVGTDRGLEAKVLPKMGWPLILVGSTSIKDRKGFGRFLAWARAPFSVMHAVLILIAEAPKLLVSIGGYAAGPFSIAAWILHVPFVVVEPNAIAGFTNRMVGRFAKRAFVAFDEAGSYFPAGKVMVSGNPVREGVINARRPVVGPGEKFTVFVFGGSQGARRLNQAMTGAAPLLAQFREGIRILHQTGSSDDMAAIERIYELAGIDAKVFTFSDRIWECYANADIVVARSGATTIAELLVLWTPAILVPYPYAADDHQRANAKGMVKCGGAVVVEDGECTGERLANEIITFIERPQLLVAMREAIKKASKPDAAKVIVEEIWKIIEG